MLSKLVRWVWHSTDEFVAQKTGTMTGQFYKELLRRDEGAFWNTLIVATGVYAAQCLLLGGVAFFSWCLYLCFRKNLVTSLHDLYFENNVYYTINSIEDQGIDNPDQRITQDVEKMSPFVIAYYTFKTWQTAGGFGVALIYLYFMVGAALNRVLISPLTKWAARVEKAEGDFRFKHVSVRNHAEESAFYQAADFEKHSSNEFFQLLWNAQRKLVLWQFPTQG
uniref:ABC transporter domain containing protein n=1 Tax=Haemonchus contortus TaxID=6289 RepID=W6NG46_HAECO